MQSTLNLSVLCCISEWSSEEGALLLFLFLLLHVVLLLLLPSLHLQSAHHLLQHSVVVVLLLLSDAWWGSPQRGPETCHGDGAPQPPRRLGLQPTAAAAVLSCTPAASEGQRSATLLKCLKKNIIQSCRTY